MSELSNSKLKRVSVTKAAKSLSINKHDIALFLRQGRMKALGFAYKNQADNWVYVIYEENLKRFLNDIQNGEILDLTA